MRCHHNRGTGEVDGIEHTHNAHRGGGVKIAGRLVRKDYLGLVHIGARNGDTLHLAAGKLGGTLVGLGFKAHVAKRAVNLRPDLGTARADDLQCERHVLAHRLVHQQLVILKNEADLTAVRRHAAVGKTAQVMPRHVDFAAGRYLLTQQQAEECGFPSA